jgi:WD40 repeat protein
MGQSKAALGTSTSHISLWDISRQTSISNFDHHDDGIVHLASCQDNDSLLMACGLDGKLSISDTREYGPRRPCIEIIDKRGNIFENGGTSYFTQALFFEGSHSILSSTLDSE